MNTRGPYAKKEKFTENVYARYRLLRAGIANPNNISAKVIDSLAGQRRFAALDLKSNNIEPIALNTLKSIADELLSGEAPNGKGFEFLDSLRLELKEKTKSKKNVRSQIGKTQRNQESIQDIRQQLQQAELLNLQRAKAYGDLFSAITTLMKVVIMDDTVRLRLYNLLQDHRDLYAHLLAPAATESVEQTGSLRIIPGGKK